MDLRREKDIEQLRRIALTQQQQLEQLLKVLAAQSRRLDELTGGDGELQQSLALLEKLQKEAADKQKAADESEAGEPKTEPKKRKKRTKSGPTAQPKLPIVPQVFELDEADKICPKCGDELAPMEGQFDISQMIDVVEVEYRIVEVKQQKYRCRCNGCIETALGPERAIRGGRYSLPFAIKVGIDKYLDHLPLARQARILERHNVEVTTQALWDQIHALVDPTSLRPADGIGERQGPLSNRACGFPAHGLPMASRVAALRSPP